MNLIRRIKTKTDIINTLEELELENRTRHNNIKEAQEEGNRCTRV